MKGIHHLGRRQKPRGLRGGFRRRRKIRRMRQRRSRGRRRRRKGGGEEQTDKIREPLTEVREIEGVESG